MKMIGKLFSRRETGMATEVARSKDPSAPLRTLGLRDRPFRAARHGFLLTRSEASGVPLERLVDDCRRGGDVLLATTSVADIQHPLGVMLEASQEAEFLVTTIQADLLMGADEVLERISEALALATGHAYTPRDMMPGLREFLASQHEVQGMIVQIEDAHELGADVLDILLELAADPAGGGALRLVLWGEAYLWQSLEYLLSERGLNGAHVEIPRFTRDDISDYLEHCLVESGYTGDFPFSETQIEKIYLESQSQPHMIDALADDELESIAAGAGSQRKSFALPLPHSLAAGVLLASLGGLYVWQDSGLSFATGQQSPSVAVRQASSRVVVPIDTSRLNATAAETRDLSALSASQRPVDAAESAMTTRTVEPVTLESPDEIGLLEIAETPAEDALEERDSEVATTTSPSAEQTQELAASPQPPAPVEEKAAEPSTAAAAPAAALASTQAAAT